MPVIVPFATAIAGWMFVGSSRGARAPVGAAATYRIRFDHQQETSLGGDQGGLTTRTHLLGTVALVPAGQTDR